MHMQQDYSEFVGQVMEYAVDSAAEPTIRLSGREIGKLSEDTFVDKLYIQWPNQDFEARLFETIVASTQLTCVAAFRGCGKTSAIRHAVARVHRDPEYRDKVTPVLIDVKRLYAAGVFAPLPEQPTPDAVAASYQVFKTEIRKIVQQRLLPGPQNTLKLLAWTLAGPPDETDTFSDLLVAGVIDLSDPVIVAAGALKKSRRDRIAAIEHFLEKSDHFIQYHRDSIAHIGTAHVVRAGMAIFGWQRVALIFDNVDRIAIPYQIKFMEAVNDTHNALGGECSTVVAVRRETLRWPSPRSNEKGDPINLIAPNETEYPTVLFPDTKPEHVSRILQARHDYSVALYSDNTTDDDVAYVTALHASVVDEFVKDSIHALANGSIRALAKIYTGFFRYVHRAEHSNVMRGQQGMLRTDDGYLQTLFFLYLRENAKEYGLIYHEIVRPESDQAAAAEVPDLASTHHLLITTLLNLTQDVRQTAGGVHDATFNKLYLRMASLGFRTDDIISALSDLHGADDEGPCTIEFVDSHPDFYALAPGSTVRLRLTPLGFVLATVLLHKVGYVWGQAYDRYVRGAGRREQSKTYYELSQADRIRIFFSYVRDLMLGHLKLLALVRKRLQPRHGKRWMEVYRSDFCVEGYFHVERLCLSAANFYQPHVPMGQGNPFRNLQSCYDELVLAIENGVAFDDLPVAKLNWRIEDFYTMGIRP
jgi:hypothetical protein